jgi:hypothetical protein
MGQLLRKMNQARQQLRQRRPQSGPLEKGPRKGQAMRQGRMRRGKAPMANVGPNRGRGFSPSMRGKGLRRGPGRGKFNAPFDREGHRGPQRMRRMGRRGGRQYRAREHRPGGMDAPPRQHHW